MKEELISSLHHDLNHHGEVIRRHTCFIFLHIHLLGEITAFLLLDLLIALLLTIRIHQDAIAFHLKLLGKEQMVNAALRETIRMEVVEGTIRRIAELRYLIRISHNT